MKDNSNQFIKEIEVSLADHKLFGDCGLIKKRMLAVYEIIFKTRLRCIPFVDAFLEALNQASEAQRYKVLTDPVVRGIAADVFGEVSDTRLEAVESVFTSAARLLRSTQPVAPLESERCALTRVGSTPDAPFIWEKEADGLFSRGFEQFSDRHLSQAEPPLSLSTADRRMEDMLVMGAELLSELLPSLFESVHPHVKIIAIVAPKHAQSESRLQSTSLSIPDMPGVIFLYPLSMDNLWSAAEALLHEGLHQKYFDIRMGHCFTNLNGETMIDVPWRENTQWSLNKTAGAFHVYVHLCLFGLAWERRAVEIAERYGPLNDIDPKAEIKQSFTRASYLGGELSRATQDCAEVDGTAFIYWLVDILDALAPSVRELTDG